MRFRTPQQSPRFLSRRDRARLMWLGMALVLVIAAIKVAADPATWASFFSGATDEATAAAALSDVSFDVALADESLRPDEFRSEPAPEAGSDANAATSATDADAATDATATMDAATEAAAEVDPAADMEFDPAVFSDVEDNTLNLRVSERDAYFTVLSRLRDLDAAAIDAAADPHATFPTVMIEPDHFRGRPVAIEGIARRILELPAGANPAGFETLYELWVFTTDSGNNPWRIVAVDLPAGLPRGVLDEGVPVRATGIFFKRQGYETQRHELHVAPLLLAKSVERTRSATRAIVDFDPTPWVLGAVAILLVGLGLLFWRFRREDRTFEKTTLDRFTAASAEDVASIPPAEASDPDEFFRQMRKDELGVSDEKETPGEKPAGGAMPDSEQE